MTTLALVLVGVCCAADGESVAREIIREQVKPNGQASPALIADTGWQTVHGFNWQMLAVDEATGEQTPVRSDQTFRTGQAFKLRVLALTDLYIYVLNENASGSVATLFPIKAEQHLLIQAGSEVKVPPDAPSGRDQFRFTRPVGKKKPPYVEQFYIIASPIELDWANPAQYLPPEKKAANEKSLDDSVNRARTNVVCGKAFDQVVKECEQVPTARGKDLNLLAPPTDGGQQVVHASPTQNDSRPFLVPVILKHKE